MKPYPVPAKFGSFPGELDEQNTSDKEIKASAVSFHVRFQRLAIERAPWIPAGAPAPVRGKREWVQWRLNLLGFFAGVVDGEDSEQLRRALRRFSAECPGIDETEDETSSTLLDELAKDTLKNELLEADDGAAYARDAKTAIEDKTLNSRGYVLTSEFYDPAGQNGTDGFYVTDGHADKEKKRLDRFEMPLQAKLYLASKTGAADGIDAPLAVGEAQVEWSTIDPPEDDAVLPAWSATNPTVSKAYLKLTHEWHAGKPSDKTDPRDNCHQRFGGVRTDDDPASLYFAPLYPEQELTERAGRVFTTGEGGVVPVLFRGSYIAGDNYIVKARLAFDGLAGEKILTAAHDARKDALADQTGRLTIWRRRLVSGVISLVGKDTVLAPVDFTDLVAAFKSAFVHVEVPAEPVIDLGALLTSEEKTEWARIYATEVVAAAGVDPKARPALLDRVAFRTDQYDGLPSPDPFPGMPENDGKKIALSTRASQLRNNLWVAFNGKLVGRAAESTRGRGLRHVLLKALKRTRRPGIVVIRGDLVAPVKVGPTTWRTPRDGDSSIGMPGGFALLGMNHVETFKDGFLVTHEAAHTMFMQHSFNTNGATWKTKDFSATRADLKGWENPLEHDLGDLNCVMSYPNPAGLKAEARPAIDASRGGPSVLRFCGKCLLKLRGWRIAGGKADQQDATDKGRAFDDDPVTAKAQHRLPYRSRSYDDAKANKAPA